MAERSPDRPAAAGAGYRLSRLGFVPVVLATGAGANARHSLGTAVFGGMIVSTLLSLLLVRVLFVLIERLREWRARRTPAPG